MYLLVLGRGHQWIKDYDGKHTSCGNVCVGGSVLCCQKIKMLFFNGNCAVFKTLCQYAAAVCFPSDASGILTPVLLIQYMKQSLQEITQTFSKMLFHSFIFYNRVLYDFSNFRNLL